MFAHTIIAGIHVTLRSTCTITWPGIAERQGAGEALAVHEVQVASAMQKQIVESSMISMEPESVP